MTKNISGAFKVFKLKAIQYIQMRRVVLITLEMPVYMTFITIIYLIEILGYTAVYETFFLCSEKSLELF